MPTHSESFRYVISIVTDVILFMWFHFLDVAGVRQARWGVVSSFSKTSGTISRTLVNPSGAVVTVSHVINRCSTAGVRFQLFWPTSL